MKPLEVMIVEDQHLLREGLKAMLEADGSVSVVSLAGSAEEALDVLLTSSCEVILMDITLPQRDGVWCIRSIRERGSQIPILVVTSHEQDRTVRDALSAGANGYELKLSTPEELRRALQEVRRGGSYVQPTLLRAMITSMAEPVKPSRSELDLLALAAERGAGYVAMHNSGGADKTDTAFPDGVVAAVRSFFEKALAAA